jgi:gamma-glutamylcyclotransferase
MRRPGAFVWGVVFRMPEADLGRLDMIEGGYERTTVEVELDDRALACATYASTLRIDDAVPFDWYKRHIVAGAVEHGLPADYIAFLRLLPQRSPS